MFRIFSTILLCCRQQDLLKKVVEVKPKRPRVSSPRDDKNSTVSTSIERPANSKTDAKQGEKVSPSVGSNKAKDNGDNPVKSLLVAYVNSDSDEDWWMIKKSVL